MTQTYNDPGWKRQTAPPDDIDRPLPAPTDGQQTEGSLPASKDSEDSRLMILAGKTVKPSTAKSLPYTSRNAAQILKSIESLMLQQNDKLERIIRLLRPSI